MLRTPFPLPVCPPPYSQGSKAAQQCDFNAKLYKDFWKFSVDEASKLLEQKDPDYWERKGEQLALELFHAAAERASTPNVIHRETVSKLQLRYNRHN